MRPDRLVVGEVRGPEALDMLQAMNTGHDGSLSTCHANGSVDALRRIETMALMSSTGLPLAAIREQLVGAIDLLVHVVRADGGARRVAEVAEVAAGPRGSVTTRHLATGRQHHGHPARPARRHGFAGWAGEAAGPAGLPHHPGSGEWVE
jgi:pilus assembly protein CpaF